MKTEILQPNLNLQSIVDFVRLNKTQQITMLAEEAVLLDLDTEKKTITRLYFIDGFFVEEIFSRALNKVIDIIPYRKGFRIKNFIKPENFAPNVRLVHRPFCIN
jgi:hypothetical protein